jgi:uncharacterized protein YjlB
MRFRGDGYIPNSTLPVLFYQKVIRLARKTDPAALMEVVFNAHGWGDPWRNGVYDFVHYHSMIHEVLGVARGSASLRIGGNKGQTLRISSGDVVIIPAGVGHECLKADKRFLAVGAYPPKGKYNECRASFQEYDRAVNAIRKVPIPAKNPVTGKPMW